MRTVAVLLAAGKGTRMRSDLAKVLHRFRGEPLVIHPLRAARAFGVVRSIVIVGHQREAVEAAVRAACPAADGWAIDFAVQAEQRGTGHAVLCALPAIDDALAEGDGVDRDGVDRDGVDRDGADRDGVDRDGAVLILSGDVPLLRAQTLAELAAACEASTAGLALASFRPADPTGYGRIIRDGAGRPVAIREQADAGAAEQAIDECNAGVYCVRASHLRRELPTLGSANAAGEIYLTDLLALRARAGEVRVVEVDAIEVAGVNTPEQLQALEGGQS